LAPQSPAVKLIGLKRAEVHGVTHDLDPDASAAVEVRSWYEARLRPRLARAARLGLADEGRLQALDDDLSALTGGDPMPGLVAAPKRPASMRRPIPDSAYDGPS